MLKINFIIGFLLASMSAFGQNRRPDYKDFNGFTCTVRGSLQGQSAPNNKSNLVIRSFKPGCETGLPDCTERQVEAILEVPTLNKNSDEISKTRRKNLGYLFPEIEKTTAGHKIKIFYSQDGKIKSTETPLLSVAMDYSNGVQKVEELNSPFNEFTADLKYGLRECMLNGSMILPTAISNGSLKGNQYDTKVIISKKDFLQIALKQSMREENESIAEVVVQKLSDANSKLEGQLVDSDIENLKELFQRTIQTRQAADYVVYNLARDLLNLQLRDEQLMELFDILTSKGYVNEIPLDKLPVQLKERYCHFLILSGTNRQICSK